MPCIVCLACGLSRVRVLDCVSGMLPSIGLYLASKHGQCNTWKYFLSVGYVTLNSHHDFCRMESEVFSGPSGVGWKYSPSVGT